jgi:hypothetical protein
MASFKTMLIVKMITLWNILCDFFRATKEEITSFYEYIRDYYYGHHNIWIFIPGHTAPISLNNLHNTTQFNWIYDNNDISLSICASENTDLNTYKFSWLSAKIRIFTSENKGFEYNIDNFIENFQLITFDDIVPSLYMVFMCWCASTKNWFNADNLIEIHIIDNMGDEHILNVEEHNDSLCIKYNKICVVIHTDNETNDQIINLEESNKDETSLLEENINKED